MAVLKRNNNQLKLTAKKEKGKGRKFLAMTIIMAVVMFGCTMISMLSYHIEMFESNIVMVYLLGILIISYLAGNYLYSLFASVIAVLLFNFFFTVPYYTFKVDDANYLLTFFVMFTVGFITSMLTIRVRLEKQLVEEREEYISTLYDIEKKLLNVKSREELAQVAAVQIADYFGGSVIVSFYGSSGEVLASHIEGDDLFAGATDQAAMKEAYASGNQCGWGTNLFHDARAVYLPIFSQYGVQGVMGIALETGSGLSPAQQRLLDLVAPQIAVVLQREKNFEKQQKAQLEIQKERLRADMLRSVSHDFRTPLAGVMGLASTALDNYDKLDDQIRKNFLRSIYEDANWLNEMVENILQTTRFEEGRVNLNIAQEAAEEIITEAVIHVKKHANKHKFLVNIPDEIILIQADGVLIRQVLVNLLNNAVSYSPEGSEISLTLHRDGNRAVFEVEDDGPGLGKEEIEHVFDRYYRSKASGVVKSRGMGLGLSLCKSIVEAHGGEITIANKAPHGTIVSFYVATQKEN